MLLSTVVLGRFQIRILLGLMGIDPYGNYLDKMAEVQGGQLHINQDGRCFRDVEHLCQGASKMIR